MQNFMKTILSAVQTWTKGEIKESTADWNQNDPNADNYVKNRTHWEERDVLYIVPEQTARVYDAYGASELYSPGLKLTIDETYVVKLNGITYECIARQYDEHSLFIGNRLLHDSNDVGDGEPFAIEHDAYGFVLFTETPGDHTVSVYGPHVVTHKINSRYLDLPDTVVTTYDMEEAVGSKMDIRDPVGVGTFSINRASHNPIGFDSVSLGSSSVASGSYSHTTGRATTASGDYSTANGCSTTASGDYSYSSGYRTTASGTYSHSSGYKTTASGTNSHAEGRDTKAIGNYSHAEGYYTTASGHYSHAEGLYTTASGQNAHVEGRYNINDTTNTYAHIVGNGISDTERSNAYTLDWNGVGWFQGGLQVGGNAQDDGAKTVLLEGDAIPIPEIATVGQTIAVKSVDENGKPVEWEATDFSASGGSGCIASDIAPEDTSVLWIDTADNSDDTLQDAVNIALAQAKESGEFKGDPGKTPEKGVDYYTDTDKTELVNAVLSALPAWTGGSY